MKCVSVHDIYSSVYYWSKPIQYKEAASDTSELYLWFFDLSHEFFLMLWILNIFLSLNTLFVKLSCHFLFMTYYQMEINNHNRYKNSQKVRTIQLTLSIITDQFHHKNVFWIQRFYVTTFTVFYPQIIFIYFSYFFSFQLIIIL